MSRTVDRAENPRPLYETLPKAVAAAIAHGNETINAVKWAETYHCKPDEVTAEFTRQLTKIPPAIDASEEYAK